MNHQPPHGEDRDQPWETVGSQDWSTNHQAEPRYHQPGYGQQQAPRGRGRQRRPVHPHAAAFAPSTDRMTFIRKTYSHVMMAIFACMVLMFLFMQSAFFVPVLNFMAGSWLIVLVLFMGATWAGDYMAHRVDSKGLQYIGLLVVTGAYAIVLSLPVTIGMMSHGGTLIFQAMIVTGLTFGGLTIGVFASGKDFSILRTGLIVMSFLAIGAIVAGTVFGFHLGLGFAIIMVGFSAAMIIYQTSNILHHYPTNHHVGASLALFSSIGMLFWYVLSIFMSLDR